MSKDFILIDPRLKHAFASMFLYGLERIFGNRQIKYRISPFRELRHTSVEENFDQYLAFIVGKNLRVIVDYRDKSTFNLEALSWSDIYAKVNFKSTEIEGLSSDFINKIIPIGPNFGINQWSLLGLYGEFLLNRLRIGFRSDLMVDLRTYMAGYNWTRRRRRIEDYRVSTSDSGYVFHASRYYTNQSHGATTNRVRAEFIRAVRACEGVQFEGGLVGARPGNEEFGDLALRQGYASAVYLNKTARSSVVFNTPAAWGCNGWKLGEYFALGKAIISTPFVNDIPPGVEHGINIHILDVSLPVREQVKGLLDDQSYREHLERNARTYFEDHLEPEKMMAGILECGRKMAKRVQA